MPNKNHKSHTRPTVGHKEAKEWTDRVAHTGDKVPHDAWDEQVRASSEDVGVGLASLVHAPGDGRGDDKCDKLKYMFMRENSRCDMMRGQ